MYQKYWNLNLRPFDNTVDERFFFYSKSHEEALIRLLYTLSENKGIMALTGASGTGKTLLCEIVRRQLATKGYQVAMLVNPDLEPVDFLRALLRGLGVRSEHKTKGELLWALEDFARDARHRNADCVLIVDEAQAISNPATLEEIRLLTNLQNSSRYLVTIFLVGSDSLPARLRAQPELAQRIGVSFQLDPLSEEETGRYIRHRIATAGGEEGLFDPSAIEQVYRSTGGVPRAINATCDAALLLGSGAEATTIDAHIIQEADAEAQLLR